MQKLTIAALALAGASMPALAGETILYESAPDWIERADISAIDPSVKSPVVLLEKQIRLEEGRVWQFQDMAVKLDSPEALTAFGTITASWLPDKGDLVVHDLKILRGDETIDLIEGGTRFEVIRRESALERRMLNGLLTATTPIPGARVGDTVRMAYSSTLSDQALGEDVQVAEGLPAEPFPMEQGRVVLSWPESLDVRWQATRDIEPASDETDGGFRTVVFDLPVAELEERPADAPARFRRAGMVGATTFDGWQDLSATLAPHFSTEGTIGEGSPLAGIVSGIASEEASDLARTAAALKLVQDDISYLMNGLNGGNYLPQSPEETWEQRYGDCKAKSLLLAAMLERMGIDAQVALVRMQNGDAVAGSLPMAAMFDHMIVRARIDGRDYWLDGTASGDRLDTLSDTPRYHYALPLVPGGSDLVDMPVAAKQVPDSRLALTVDQSAGLRVPALVDARLEFRGREGAALRAIASQGDDESVEEMAQALLTGAIGSAYLVDEQLDYDEASGVATVTAKGVQTTAWSRDENVLEFEAPGNLMDQLSFAADRARAEWRDIPLNINGPTYKTESVTVILPDGPSYAIDGEIRSADTIGGVEVASQAALDGNRFTLARSVRTVAYEIPAADAPVARRSLAGFRRSLARLETANDARQPWEYFGSDRSLLKPVEAMYARIVAEAEPDDTLAYTNRAAFRRGVYDFAGALEDVEAAIAIEESEDLLRERAALRLRTGDYDGMIEDVDRLAELDPTEVPWFDRFVLLAIEGRHGEAEDYAETYLALSQDDREETLAHATVLGWVGKAQEAQGLLEELADERPNDDQVLNAACWNAAVWDLMTEDRLATCTAAVEKSANPAAARDSRAFGYYRLGRLEEARSDLDIVLSDHPHLAESRLLRGIVRKELGDGAGKRDIELALKMSPFLRPTYEAYGLEF